jgi:hypothetical protein
MGALYFMIEYIKIDLKRTKTAGRKKYNFHANSLGVSSDSSFEKKRPTV